MSDTNKSQFKQTLLTVLLLLLFLLVSLQAWYMFKMKKQLDVLHNQQSSVQLQLQAQDTTANEKDMPEKNHTGPNNTEELPDEQQSSVQLQLQAQDATANEKDMPEKNHTGANNTEEPAGEQQLSLQENQHMQPAQTQDESLSADDTQPLIHNEPSDTTFGGQSWNPYSEIERTQHDMDRKFNRRFDHFTNRPDFNNPGFNNPDLNRPDFQYHFSQSISTPKMNVNENANQYIVFVNLPGADESEISVTLNGQRLTVKSKQDYKKQNRDSMGNTIFQVRQSGRFQRSITLANPVNKHQIKTRLNTGVLTIIIPNVKNGQWR
jgi:HSP20 family molecular chaperone IbpA